MQSQTPQLHHQPLTFLSAVPHKLVGRNHRMPTENSVVQGLTALPGEVFSDVIRYLGPTDFKALRACSAKLYHWIGILVARDLKIRTMPQQSDPRYYRFIAACAPAVRSAPWVDPAVRTTLSKRILGNL